MFHHSQYEDIEINFGIKSDFTTSFNMHIYIYIYMFLLKQLPIFSIHIQYLVVFISLYKKSCFLPHCKLQIPSDCLASTRVDSNIYKYLPNMIPHETGKSDVVEHGYERRRLMCNNSLVALCFIHLELFVGRIHWGVLGEASTASIEPSRL